MADQERIDSFVVTARKWRPQLFSEVVGQEHISTTLSNALLSGRVHHAYLFCGPRGVGKTTTARIFARALNCTNSKNGIEPCNECDSCKDILSGRSMDVIEIDGASNNSVDDIRKLRENAKYPPVHGRYKMYIIDEVHMLSTSAFNALLKTLEEPPPHLLFMFATTESQKVPATIVSRCQRFDFRRMQIDDIVKHLAYIAGEEKVTIDEASLVAIAKKGDGSMRDSQSIFDQVRAFCGDTIAIGELSNALHLIDEDFFFSISDAIRKRDAASMFDLVKQLVTRGYDIHECLSGLTEHFRNILSIVVTKQTTLIESSAASIERYRQTANDFLQADVLRIMTMISAADAQLRFSAQPRFRLELLLTQLASMDSTVEIGQLLSEVRDLKKNGSKIGMLSAPVHATMPSPPAVHRAAPAAAQPPTLSSTVRVDDSTPRASTTASARPSSASKSSVSAPAPASALAPTPSAMSASSKATSAAGSASPRSTMSAQASINQAVDNSVAQSFVEGPLISASVLQAGWAEFVKSFPPSLAAIKLSFNSKEVCSVRFFDGEVLVLNSEKFMCDDLNARRAPLGNQFEKFYGASVRVRVVYTADIHEQHSDAVTESIASNGLTESSISTQAAPSATTSASEASTQPSNSLAPGERLPIEKSLVDLFSAKKIPLQSN